VVERGMEGVGESRGISEEVLASLREGVVSDELYNNRLPQSQGDAVLWKRCGDGELQALEVSVHVVKINKFAVTECLYDARVGSMGPVEEALALE
jgi:hypothetical protein